MTKKELAIAIAEKGNVSQAKAAEMIDMVIDTIRESLEAGSEVTVRGFGAFKPVKAAPRSGRNLRTKERVVIPAKTRVKFKSYMEEKEVAE
jgi:nucleoid DNA-binding protein